MDITPLGDSALIVRVAERVDEMPERTLREVLAVQQRIVAARLPAVIEVAVAYTTVAVFFDPVQAAAAGAPDTAEWLAERIRAIVECGDAGGVRAPVQARLVEIPVCYAGEFGPDLADVAWHAGLASDDVVRRHNEAEYCVHCIGFSPGFPYLGGLPSELAVPRRAVPRTDVPAGSVAIGGMQTGIYPRRSPGGWHLIGRTPMVLFDADAADPALLRAGDRVRFRPITREQFEAWKP